MPTTTDRLVPPSAARRPALRRRDRLVVVAALAATLAAALFNAGCAPVVVAAAAGGAALVATDRRSAGVQLDDQTIETKIASSIVNRRFGDAVHVSATSYNALVLLTGEVPDAGTRDEIERIARSTDRVRSVQNEIVVAPPSSLGSRTNDSYLTSVVKARLVENSQISANHVKVVTERGTVYLMGIVSRAEGDIAAQVASSTTNVARVVKVFEYNG